MLHDELRILKEKRKVSMQKLSETSGIPMSTLHRILSGQTSDPQFSNVVDIVKALGGSLDEIAGIYNKNTHEETIKSLTEQLNEKNKWLVRMFVFSCVLIAVIIISIVIDILVSNVGYIRY